MERVVTLPVRAEEDGLRLDLFLLRRLTRFSRQEIQRRIARGEVARAAHPVKPAARVFSGEAITLRYEVPDLPEDHAPLTAPPVLYEDARVLVVDKGPDLPVHPCGGFRERSVLTALQQARPGERLSPAHRLDRETSGVLLFAKDPNADRSLKRAFLERRCHKAYLALVRGAPSEDEFTIDQAIGPAGSGVRARWAPLPEAQGGYAARTRARVLWRSERGARLLLHPETGRQHQLRVHLSARGLPIVGDKLYSGDESLYTEFAKHRGMTPRLWEVLGAARQALHAHQLSFPHPDDGRALTITSPWPDDLAALEASLAAPIAHQ